MLLLLMLFSMSTIFFERSDSDMELLARLIDAEARGEPYEGMLAVGNVVINRLDGGEWGNSIEKVIYSKNQFAKPSKTYSQESLQAAKEILQGTRVIPNYIMYFQRAKRSYFYGKWYKTIGNHNFYGDVKNDEN